MSARTVGYLVRWENGHLWSDGHGNIVMLTGEPSADFLRSLGDGAVAVPIIRWKPPAKKPHERGTHAN